MYACIAFAHEELLPSLACHCGRLLLAESCLNSNVFKTVTWRGATCDHPALFDYFAARKLTFSVSLWFCYTVKV